MSDSREGIPNGHRPIAESMRPAAPAPVVTDITFVAAPAAIVADGLLAWGSCRHGKLWITNICIRRTRGGTLRVIFPIRVDARGRKHEIVSPEDPATRAAIVAAILAAWQRERSA